MLFHSFAKELKGYHRANAKLLIKEALRQVGDDNCAFLALPCMTSLVIIHLCEECQGPLLCMLVVHSSGIPTVHSCFLFATSPQSDTGDEESPCSAASLSYTQFDEWILLDEAWQMCPPIVEVLKDLKVF